jgi:enterochelin esterase-like enzyme
VHETRLRNPVSTKPVSETPIISRVCADRPAPRAPGRATRRVAENLLCEGAESALQIHSNGFWLRGPGRTELLWQRHAAFARFVVLESDMSPTSPLVEFLLLGVTVGLLIALVTLRRLAVRVAAAVLVIFSAMSAGIVAVNDYVGYYRTWGDAVKDLSGASLDTGLLEAGVSGKPVRLNTSNAGTVQELQLPGNLSHISRGGFVYLPAQYWQSQYRDTRFPVIELLHGARGKPSDWIRSMHINQVVDTLISERQMGPVIMVAPTIAPPRTAQECLNSSNALDETYINTDVPADLRMRFRVSDDPAQWALFGLSAGGYCAANLGLRHRAQWGAVVSLGGYYLPSDGDAQAIITRNPKLALGNNPVQTALDLRSGTAPLPGFWISAGTGNADDMTEARLLERALAHLERIHVTVVDGGQHTMSSLRQPMPAALEWAWAQLSTPSQKMQFPIAGAANTDTQQAVTPGSGTPRGHTIVRANTSTRLARHV